MTRPAQLGSRITCMAANVDKRSRHCSSRARSFAVTSMISTTKEFISSTYKWTTVLILNLILFQLHQLQKKQKEKFLPSTEESKSRMPLTALRQPLSQQHPSNFGHLPVKQRKRWFDYCIYMISFCAYNFNAMRLLFIINGESNTKITHVLLLQRLGGGECWPSEILLLHAKN